MKFSHYNGVFVAAALVATLGCATTRDLKGLQQENNVRLEQLRKEFSLLREGVTRLQQDIQREREAKTPALNRLEQETQSIRRDVAKSNQAVLLMGEAVTVMAEQLGAGLGTDEKGPKPRPSQDVPR